MALKSTTAFDHARHVSFWLRCSALLPTQYTSADANRMSLGFFIVSALDLLGLLDDGHPKAIKAQERRGWVDWIYSLQCEPGGFRGGAGLKVEGWDGGSLANSFLALVSLLILGDDLGRVRKPELAQWVMNLQRPNGGFAEHLPGPGTGEAGARDDMRMCYCATGVQYILGNGYMCVDRGLLRRFVVNAQGYEGGVAQSPGLEGHSGLNFCALGCLEMLRRLDGVSRHDPGWHFERLGLEVQECVRYVIMRQTTWVEDETEDDDDDDANGDTAVEDPGIHLQDHRSPIAGLNGRTNKMADTCYCYWNLGALEILGITHHANRESVRRYLCETTQHRIGGFVKAPGEHPDLMHSYLGLAALAVMGEEGLKQLDPALCASLDVRQRLAKLPWRMAEE